MDLKTYLAENDLYGYEFAEQIGANRATVSRLVNGSCMPTLRVAMAIQQVTGGKVGYEDFLKAKANYDANYTGRED